MSEWIEKEEVLKQIDCWFTTGEYKYSNATHYLNKRISSIKPKESEWVSVKDKLPEQYTDVIVFIKGDTIAVDYVDENGDFYYYGEYVTHWMPLSKPPESE
jgi:hypothetical protein